MINFIVVLVSVSCLLPSLSLRSTSQLILRQRIFIKGSTVAKASHIIPLRAQITDEPELARIKQEVGLTTLLQSPSPSTTSSNNATASPPSSGGGKKRPENVNLFAAEDRKAVMTGTAPGPVTSTAGTSSSTKTTTSSSSSSSLIASSSQQYEVQAELLRLEAAREGLVLDRDRLARQRARYLLIDDLLMEMLTPILQQVESQGEAEDGFAQQETVLRLVNDTARSYLPGPGAGPGPSSTVAMTRQSSYSINEEQQGEDGRRRTNLLSLSVEQLVSDPALYLRLAELTNAASTARPLSSETIPQRFVLFALYDALLARLEEVQPTAAASLRAELDKEITAELTTAASRRSSSSSSTSNAGGFQELGGENRWQELGEDEKYSQVLRDFLTQVANRSSTVLSPSNMTALDMNNASIVDFANLANAPLMLVSPPALPAMLVPYILALPPSSRLAGKDLAAINLLFSDAMGVLVKPAGATYTLSNLLSVFPGDLPANRSAAASYQRALAILDEMDKGEASKGYEEFKGIKSRINLFLLPNYLPRSSVTRGQQRTGGRSPSLPSISSPTSSPTSLNTGSSGLEVSPDGRRVKVRIGIDPPNNASTLLEPYSGRPFTPVFAVLPAQVKPAAPGPFQRFFQVSSLALAGVTSLLFLGDLFVLNPGFLRALLAPEASQADQMQLLARTLAPPFLALWSLGLAHDLLGHLLAASLLYDREDQGSQGQGKEKGPLLSRFPLFLPSFQLGLLGSQTRFLRYPASRNALFDIALAGPFVGLLLSLVCLAIGLQQGVDVASLQEQLGGVGTGVGGTGIGQPLSLDSLTMSLGAIITTAVDTRAAGGGAGVAAGIVDQVSSSSTATASSLFYPFLPNRLVQSSYLLFSLLGSPMNPLAVTPVHPLVVAAIAGLFSNSLAMLPVGRLDGGRVAMAVAGRAAANRLSFFTLLTVAASFIFGDGSGSSSPPILLYFMIATIFLFRSPDLPPLDDVTPVSSDDQQEAGGKLRQAARAVALAFCLLVATTVLIPVPAELLDAVPTTLSSSPGPSALLDSLPSSPNMPSPSVDLNTLFSKTPPGSTDI